VGQVELDGCGLRGGPGPAAGEVWEGFGRVHSIIVRLQHPSVCVHVCHSVLLVVCGCVKVLVLLCIGVGVTVCVCVFVCVRARKRVC
jgi:hypothetical protein